MSKFQKILRKSEKFENEKCFPEINFFVSLLSDSFKQFKV